MPRGTTQVVTRGASNHWCQMCRYEVRGGRHVSTRRELRNELKYVQIGVKMNEISCLKVRHVEHKIWELEAIPHRPKKKVDSGEWAPNGKKLIIISVYAPQELREKKMLWEMLWDYLILVLKSWNGDVIIMGDFNEVRTQDERHGSIFNAHGADAFNLFISSAGLEEVPLDGCKFTWCHKSGSKMSKLDRFLIYEGLLNSCPNISSITLDRYLSDHRPILMRESHHDYGPSPFRFFHYWFELEGFDTFVKQTWNDAQVTDSNAISMFMKKMKYLKEKIRMWVKANKENSKSHKQCLQEELSKIDLLLDKGEGSSTLISKRMEILKSIQDFVKLDTMELAQKAKIKWAIEGDENSKYYHGMKPIDKFVLYKNEVEISNLATVFAERKNRTLKEMITAMLISSGMSQDMWGEAILMATYLLNKIHRKEKEETLLIMDEDEKTIISVLRNNNAYPFIVHESKNLDIQKNTVMESQNASFFEYIFPYLSKEIGSSARLDDEVVQDKRTKDVMISNNERQDQTEEKMNLRLTEKRCKTTGIIGFQEEDESYGTIDKYKARCNDKMIKSTKDMLKSKFDMKDMGLADGIPAKLETPIDTSTRPDLAYAVSRLSRLHYDRYPAVLEGYSDAN
ncbi:RNA-directed DNA polymerase, eukaryota [Tanacetum coccineum]